MNVADSQRAAPELLKPVAVDSFESCYCLVVIMGKTTKNFIFEVSTALLLAVFFIALSGCSKEPEEKYPDCSVAAPGAAPVPSILSPRYDATLAQGIDFKTGGYPDFLDEVTGMSGREDWGRWTEAAYGAAATFRFKQPLPKKFTLEITGRAFGPNEDQPVRVRVGSIEKTFVMPGSAPVPSTYTLLFESTNGADTIEIVPPKPTCPSELKVSHDTRKLGLGLYSLKILE